MEDQKDQELQKLQLYEKQICAKAQEQTREIVSMLADLHEIYEAMYETAAQRDRKISQLEEENRHMQHLLEQKTKEADSYQKRASVYNKLELDTGRLASHILLYESRLEELNREKEQLARNNFVRAKRIIKENGDPYNALKLYDEALRLVQNSGDDNLKAAIHFERGKVFDDYDYAEYALQDYNRATKCSDNNLKTHAHLKMGRIYDDYVMFDPAVEQYSLAVETSEEAKNPAGKTKALRYLAGLFADRYDKENTEIFNSLSADSA